MDGTLKTTDFMTLAAMAATVVGIVLCLIFLFAPATFGEILSGDVVNGPVDMQVSMR